MRLLVLVAMVAACDSAKPAIIDAAPPDVMMEHCEGPTADAGPIDLFGETCTENPTPALTFCHNSAGWCVAGVCRPQCAGFGCPRCAGGREQYSDRGACYCAP